MIRHALPLLFAAGLAACGADHGEPEASDPAATPALAPGPGPQPPSVAEAPEPGAEQAFDAVGTEPFWAVQVRKDSLRLSRPDYAEVIVAAPPPGAKGETLAWTTDAMTISITPGACSDGMSDRRYVYVAEVKLGRETLKGCAYRPGAAPTAGPES